MNVTVDGQRCQGHGRCYELGPETFGADEEGMGRLLTGPWTPARIAAAEVGAANCPEGAIMLQPDPHAP